MKYSDEQRIEKIYDDAIKLNQLVEDKHITEKMLVDDFFVQWMITTPLYNIGEHSYNLSKEFKAKHSDIHWNMMAGLRHRSSTAKRRLRLSSMSRIVHSMTVMGRTYSRSPRLGAG